MKTLSGLIRDGRIILNLHQLFEMCRSIGDEFDIIVCTPEESTTKRQIRTYWHLVGQASEQTGYTKFEIDLDWRERYGKEFFESKETKLRDGRILLEHSSLTALSVKDMNSYITNIIHGSATDGIIIQEPDFMKRRMY